MNSRRRDALRRHKRRSVSTLRHCGLNVKFSINGHLQPQDPGDRYGGHRDEQGRFSHDPTKVYFVMHFRNQLPLLTQDESKALYTVSHLTGSLPCKLNILRSKLLAYPAIVVIHGWHWASNRGGWTYPLHLTASSLHSYLILSFYKTPINIRYWFYAFIYQLGH